MCWANDLNGTFAANPREKEIKKRRATDIVSDTHQRTRKLPKISIEQKEHEVSILVGFEANVQIVLYGLDD